MKPRNLQIVVFVFCSFTLFISMNSFGQNKSDIIGEWVGKIKDSSGEFVFKLNIEKENSGIFTGTSISKSADFYCETRVIAIRQGSKYIISELEVINTNYSNRQALCLLKLDLTISDKKLAGRYSPINNISNCLSGTVSLNKNLIPKEAPSNVSVNKVSKSKVPPSRQIVKDIDETLNLQSSILAEKDSVKKVFDINERVIKTLKVIELDESEAELIIYDNMIVDGDIITLIDNDEVILRKVALSKIPIKYKINNSRSNIHILKFYAENLGSTPPNTGILKVKSKMTEITANFNSDLMQTSSIKIILKKDDKTLKSINQ
jgi:hypothetical protein